MEENKMNNKQIQVDNEGEWKPARVEEYIVPELNLPEKLTKPTRNFLSKVLTFIYSVRPLRYKDACTIMPISGTSKKMIGICGSQQRASEFIKKLCNIGLVSVECEDYRFNAPTKEGNRSKTYRYYYENEERIEEYCKDNKIDIIRIINCKRKRYEGIIEEGERYREEVRSNNNSSSGESLVPLFLQPNFDPLQVRFDSKIQHIFPCSNQTEKDLEEYLTGLLYLNYPQLAYYQQLADKINETYYAKYPDMWLSFVPSFTWSKGGQKKINKIGIRCTNSLCSAKKEKNAKKNFYGVFKEDILKKYGLNLEKDVKSSVPRLTLSINCGHWIDENIDIYEIIYNNYLSMRSWDNEGDDLPNDFYAIRETIKSLHMRGYFDSEGRLGVNTRNNMAQVENKEAVDEEMRLFKRAIESAEGGHLYDSEIFFHESCIYMDVLYELLSRGFFVWQCYDAFYAKKRGVTQEQFQQLVSKLVAEKANNYIKKWLFANGT